MIGRLDDFQGRLLAWYDRHRRDLPWRRDDGLPDPYRVLVSEFMLQQTQVTTVVPYFERFMNQFPTPAALAAAPEQDVLRAWQGLGYYSRARNLHAAAKRIVAAHGSRVPSAEDDLLALPGVGRYTAGAIGSIAFGHRVPILDGNVARVLCRVDRVEEDPRFPPITRLLWRRSLEILPAARLGDFNSALMELGAIVCTPRSPQCLLCPVRSHCQACDGGVQDRLPLKRVRKVTPLVHRVVFVVRRGERLLIEQRLAKGRWAKLWQFPTVAAPASSPSGEVLCEVTHALTHRRYAFTAYLSEVEPPAEPDRPRKWVTLAELEKYPLSKPQLRIAAAVRALAR